MKLLINKIYEIFKKYKFKDKLITIVYPLISLVIIPCRLIEVIASITKIKKGISKKYLSFSCYKYINSMFYDVIALLFNRFGVKGKCSYYGTGEFKISRWFFHSPIAFILYWKSKPLGILLIMLIWLITFACWCGKIYWAWLIFIIFLIFISTQFYYQTFRGQHYNAFGWMFLPLGLFGLITNNFLITGLCIFASTLMSITSSLVLGYIVITQSIINGNLNFILVTLPSILFLGTRTILIVEKGKIIEYAKIILGGIGALTSKIKYRRSSTKGFNPTFFYFLFLFGQYIIVARIITGEWDSILVFTCILYFFNNIIIRFADSQSLYIVMLTTIATHIINHPQPWLLPSFLIFLSPIPATLFGISDKPPFFVPHFALTYMQSLYEGIENFFKVVKPGERVLMGLNNPKGVYENLFDGFRVLYELPNYILTEKEVFMLPTWWTIFELNYEGAPEIWGRDVDSVINNAKYWKADYIVHYQESNTTLNSQWKKNGFKLLKEFNWNYYEHLLHGEKITEKPLPKWFLLKVP
jgi:hypothetical protein